MYIVGYKCGVRCDYLVMCLLTLSPTPTVKTRKLFVFSRKNLRVASLLLMSPSVIAITLVVVVVLTRAIAYINNNKYLLYCYYK